MKATSVADFKKHLSAYVALAQRGETVEIRNRNNPVAHLIGLPRRARNRTRLGFAKGSVIFKGDVTEPLVPADQWEMLGGKR